MERYPAISVAMLDSVSLHSGRLAGYLRDLRSRSAICNTTYLLLGSNGIRPFREVVPLIRTEVQTALALDPTEPAANFLLGARRPLMTITGARRQATFE
jgi:hypothetical protein